MQDGGPPPPPPHGEKPNTTEGQYRKASNLPPGNYDIFVIPPHSSGSGFVYLPSFQYHTSSFIAGCVSTLFVTLIWSIFSPFLKAFCSSAAANSSGLAIAVISLVVAVVGWGIGILQTYMTTGALPSFGNSGAGSGQSREHSSRTRGRSGYGGGDRWKSSQSRGKSWSRYRSSTPASDDNASDADWKDDDSGEQEHQEHEQQSEQENQRKREAMEKELRERREELEREMEAAAKAAREKAEKSAADARSRADKEAAEAREKSHRDAVEAKLREMRAAAAARAQAEKEAAEAKLQAQREADRKEAAARETAKKEADAKFAALKEAAAKKYAEKKAQSEATAREAANDSKSMPSPKKSPYDRPRRPYAGTYASSEYSESSYAPSQSTARTSPPPTFRGPYKTNDPNKIVIKAVFAFNNAYMQTPFAQLVSGEGMVTDGLVLRITTEGLFIDDDKRGIPQREWDVKAWTMKLFEVWCPQVAATANGRNTPNKRRQGLPTAEESEACANNLAKVCKSRCHAEYPSASASSSRYGSSVDGDEAPSERNLHVIRASIRDQEGKKYVFVLQETEGWKVSIGLQRLRGGSLVRALGVSNIPSNDCKTLLSKLVY